MKSPGAIIIPLAAVAAAGFAGASNGPQRPSTALWYALLRKPRFTPPGAVIGVIWGVLECLLVAIGFRLLRAEPGGPRNTAVTAWFATLLGLAGYPWLMFGEKRLASSTATAGAMLGSAVGMAASARKVDPPAALMSLPLVLWLAVAATLAEELWRRNPALSAD